MRAARAVDGPGAWMRRALALASMAWLLSSCDPAGVTAPISSSCARIGAQCQLPGGPLGVCQQIECGAGVAPPCFTCVSQH